MGRVTEQTEPRGATPSATGLPHFDRVSGFARALGILVLLTGVALMHAVVFAPSHAHADAPGHTHITAPENARTTVAGHRHAVEATAVAQPDPSAPTTGTPPIDDRGCADCGTAHHGLHGCVFVLAALVLLLGLVMLARVGARRAGLRLRAPVEPVDGGRSPPWTVLSLPELSILRI